MHISCGQFQEKTAFCHCHWLLLECTGTHVSALIGSLLGGMRAIKGVLLTCDSAVKQILLAMNEKDPFIIEDLDDYHLVIKADEEYRVRKVLEAELEKNTYSLEAT